MRSTVDEDFLRCIKSEKIIIELNLDQDSRYEDNVIDQPQINNNVNSRTQTFQYQNPHNKKVQNYLKEKSYCKDQVYF